MANSRLSTRKIKEALRLKWEQGLSNKQIAKSWNIAGSTVRGYLKRAELAGLLCDIGDAFDDTPLENLLFRVKSIVPSSQPEMPPMEYLFRE